MIPEEEMKAILEKLAITIRIVVLRLVEEAYERYAQKAEIEARGGYVHEPRMTVTVVRDTIAQMSPAEVESDFWVASDRRRSAMVRSALEQLTRDGLLECSLGISPDTGREVKMWNPEPEEVPR